MYPKESANDGWYLNRALKIKVTFVLGNSQSLIRAFFLQSRQLVFNFDESRVMFHWKLYRAFSLTVASTHANLLTQKEVFTSPTGLVWFTNMAAVSLFWNTNMAAETWCENALYMKFFVFLSDLDNRAVIWSNFSHHFDYLSDNFKILIFEASWSADSSLPSSLSSSVPGRVGFSELLQRELKCPRIVQRQSNNAFLPQITSETFSTLGVDL